MITLNWADEELTLLPERAIFWPRRDTLIITDPHFGKTAAFRTAGLAVPGSDLAHDLARLNAALMQTRARRLVILGDFFHAASGRTPDTLAQLAAWRARHAACEVLLVRGNHDRGAGDPPAEWEFTCVCPPCDDPPFTFRHHPPEAGDAASFVLAGHVHPAVVLADRLGARLRMPCFHFGTRLALLPAFGVFTGAKRIAPAIEDRIFAVCPDGLVEIPPRAAGAIAPEALR